MKGNVVLPETIRAYFDTLNQKAFDQTARLFAEGGKLVPPLDGDVEGREAIAAYLQKEASDMTFTPLEYETMESEANSQEKTKEETDAANSSASDKDPKAQSFVVKGKVKNSLFVVNVGWEFALTDMQKIECVKVKLLASLKELMKIRS